MPYSQKLKADCILYVMQGHSLREAQARFGPGRQTICRWVSDAGVALRRDWIGGPMEPIRVTGFESSPSRLGLEHRLTIACGLAGGLTHREIALGIGFSRSTVSREVSRNSHDGSYDPYAAQRKASESMSRPKPRKVDASRRLRAYVLARLALEWSPEQISNSLKREFAEDEEMSLSTESIYQALYVQGKGALRQELKLEKALRTGRKARIPRSGLPPRSESGSTWVEGCEISLRPAEADDRAVPGHWEGDLVIGSDMKSCLITLVERTTRLALVRKLDLHPTALVTAELADMVSTVPEALRRSITWDRGSEMAAHMAFTEETGIKVFFCDPHSPWQRGTNENTNGLIRQYFPKGTNFANVAEEDVALVQDKLNGRPRKTLDWRCPAEAYLDYLEGSKAA